MAGGRGGGWTRWSRTENCLPSDDYGVAIGRTLLELNALVVLQRRVSQE